MALLYSITAEGSSTGIRRQMESCAYLNGKIVARTMPRLDGRAQWGVSPEGPAASLALAHSRHAGVSPSSEMVRR